MDGEISLSAALILFLVLGVILFGLGLVKGSEMVERNIRKCASAGITQDDCIKLYANEEK